MKRTFHIILCFLSYSVKYRNMETMFTTYTKTSYNRKKIKKEKKEYHGTHIMVMQQGFHHIKLVINVR